MKRCVHLTFWFPLSEESLDLLFQEPVSDASEDSEHDDDFPAGDNESRTDGSSDQVSIRVEDSSRSSLDLTRFNNFLS